MSIASNMSGILLSFEKPGNLIRGAWDRLSSIPGGKRVFSRLVGRAARYTGSIDATVLELRDGFSRVELQDRPAVRNHLRCVHAIALANLAELTANVALAYSLPEDARFIVAGMSIEYLKKARGTIVGTTRCDPITTNERKEYLVHVSMTDPKGVEVATADLRTLVGPKRK